MVCVERYAKIPKKSTKKWPSSTRTARLSPVLPLLPSVMALEKHPRLHLVARYPHFPIREEESPISINKVSTFGQSKKPPLSFSATMLPCMQSNTEARVDGCDQFFPRCEKHASIKSNTPLPEVAGVFCSCVGTAKPRRKEAPRRELASWRTTGFPYFAHRATIGLNKVLMTCRTDYLDES